MWEFDDDKGLFSKFILVARQRERWGKETKQCHTVSPRKTFNNRWQYFVIEYRYLGFSYLAKFKNFFHRKRKMKLGIFNITLKLSSWVLQKWIKIYMPSHLFLGIWLQKLFLFISVRIIKGTLMQIWKSPYMVVFIWK